MQRSAEDLVSATLTMEALSTSVAKQSAASQVWGIGHLREAILDDCAKLFTSPVQKSQFFRRCISGLDKRSVRECARHTHASVNLNDFPWDCPDSVRNGSRRSLTGVHMH